MRSGTVIVLGAGLVAALAAVTVQAQSRRTVKPVLHGRHWVAITGKPLAATAGAMIFAKGGNAVDAAAAMLAAACTMWDTLGWGGETQALVFDPRTKKVIGLNALGVAPTGATPEFFKGKGQKYPPELGPLAAVTPGTPGGLITMLAEWGRLSLADVLAPAIQMADGYPIEAQLANGLERQKQVLSGWPYSKAVFLPHPGEAREAPVAGEVFVQKDLAATLRKLVEAEAQALAAGQEPARGAAGRLRPLLHGRHRRRAGAGDAGAGRPDHEAGPRPLAPEARGAGPDELQGDRRLQAHGLDPGPRDAAGAQHPRGHRSPGHGLQLAPLHPHRLPGDQHGLRRSRLLLWRPRLPARGAGRRPALEGLREQSAGRACALDRNDPDVRPGDPYPFQGGTNPFRALLDAWRTRARQPRRGPRRTTARAAGRARTPPRRSARPR